MLSLKILHDLMPSVTTYLKRVGDDDQKQPDQIVILSLPRLNTVFVAAILNWIDSKSY